MPTREKLIIKQSPFQKRTLALLVLLILLITASRVIYLSGRQPDVDEVWSIWQTFGTPQQIVSWTPYDWPPLYYLVLGAWKSLIGIHPDVLRFLSLLVFLPGTAAIYRVGRRMFGEKAGISIMLVYAGLGYMLFLSTIIRGYAFTVALAPISLWLMLIFFTRKTLRQALLNGIVLGVCMAVMFYIHLTTVMIFALLGLYSLIVYPRRFWWWFVPGITAIMLAFPLISSKVSLAVTRTNALNTLTLPPLVQAFEQLFVDYAGHITPLAIIWGILAVIALVNTFLFGWKIKSQRSAFVAIILWLAVPLGVYLFNHYLGFFNIRYLWWGVLAVSIWLGWSVSRLPRVVFGVACGAMVVAMFVPMPDYYPIPSAPIMENFHWLKDHLKGGDVLLLDPSVNPKNASVSAETWDYFTKVYFPQGLTFVENPQGYRRIWYVTKDGFQNKPLFSAVKQGRIAREFVGPWDFLFRLYEGPPVADGIPFENGMRFHGADILSGGIGVVPVFHEGESFKVRLWWSADTPPKLDYSIGIKVFTFDLSTLLAQLDGPPQVVDISNLANTPMALPTSQMEPGQIYVDEREITLPNQVTAGSYGVFISVYDSASGTIFSAPGVNSNKLLFVQPIAVKSW